MPNFGGGPNFYYDPASRLAQAKFTANAYGSLGQGAEQMGGITAQMFQAIAAKAEQDKQDKLRMIAGLWNTIGVKATGQAAAQEFQQLSGVQLPPKINTYDPMGPNQPGQEPGMPSGEIDLDVMDNTIQQKLAAQKIEAARFNKILEVLGKHEDVQAQVEGRHQDVGTQVEGRHQDVQTMAGAHIQGANIGAGATLGAAGLRNQGNLAVEEDRAKNAAERATQAEAARMERLITKGQQQQDLAKKTTKYGMVRDKRRAILKQEYPAAPAVNPVQAAGLALRQAGKVSAVDIHRLEVQLNAMIAKDPNDPAIPDIQGQLNDAYKAYKDAVGGVNIPGLGGGSTGRGGPPIDLSRTHSKIKVQVGGKLLDVYTENPPE